MATINDVAEYAKVSKSTVSNVVGKRKYVTEELVRRVLSACEELNYVPNFTATTLVTKKTGILGLFLGTEERYDEFYDNLIKGVLLQAKEYNYKLLIYYSVDKDKMISSLTTYKEPIDGAILLKPLVHDFRIDFMTKDKVPFVLIGNFDGSENIYRVDVDNFKLSYDITQKLIDLGHKKFLFFTVDPRFTISSDRIMGFRKAMEQNNISTRNNKIIMTDHYGKDAVDFLANNTDEYPKGTAIIVPSDIVGKMIYDYFEKSEYSVGVDISVAALGGHAFAYNLNPQLTTVRVDYERIGKECVNLLYKQLEHISVNSKSVLVGAETIYTCSCATYI
jgi:DNA-binding LacI/PurR family transcriptional regulator